MMIRIIPIEKKNQGGRTEEKKYSEVLSISSLTSINGFQIHNEGLVLGRSKQFVHANRRKEVIYVDTDLSKLVDMVLAILEFLFCLHLFNFTNEIKSMHISWESGEKTTASE